MGYDVLKQLGPDSTNTSCGPKHRIPHQKLHICSNSEVYRSNSRPTYLKSCFFLSKRSGLNNYGLVLEIWPLRGIGR